MTPEQKICQQIADTFMAVAASENNAIAGEESPVYTSLRKALIRSIMIAYSVNVIKARAIYGIMIDSGESVHYTPMQIISSGIGS
jgi:hypothetical protein